MHLELDKFLSSLSISNSIVMGREISVKSVYSPSASPAWCSSDTVYINSRIFESELTEYDILTIKGANLHELAHMMFSPRNGSKLVKSVKSSGLWKSYIAMEDQRIERLMLLKYKSAWKWLAGLYIIHVSNGAINREEMYPLIAGRKYLSKKFVEQYRSIYSKDYKRVEWLVETFIIEASKKQPDLKLIMELIYEFDKFFIKNSESDPYRHDIRDFDGIESSINRPEESPSLENPIAVDVEMSELSLQIKEETLKIKQSISNEIAAPIVSSSQSVAPDGPPVGNKIISESYAEIDASAKDLAILRSFSKEIAKKIDEEVSEWENNHRYGKLDVYKFYNRKNKLNFFRIFKNLNTDTTNIYLLVDSSFSMNGVRNSLNYRFSWLINNSLNVKNFRVRTLFFSNTCREIYYTNVNKIPAVSNSGTTDLSQPINYIKKDLFNFPSNSVNKLIILSDNDFSADFSADISQLENLGIETSVIQIDSKSMKSPKNSLNIYCKISNELDLLDAITRIISK